MDNDYPADDEDEGRDYYEEADEQHDKQGKTTNYEKTYLRALKRTSNSPKVIQPVAARPSRGTRVSAPD